MNEKKKNSAKSSIRVSHLRIPPGTKYHKNRRNRSRDRISGFNLVFGNTSNTAKPILGGGGTEIDKQNLMCAIGNLLKCLTTFEGPTD